MYLQDKADVLWVRYVTSLLVAPMEPGASSYLQGRLLPVGRVTPPLFQTDIKTPALCGYNNLLLLPFMYTILLN